MNKKALLALVLVAMSCAREGAAPLARDAVSNAAPQSDARAVSTAVVTPMIVRTAEMHILVADTSKTIDAVTKQVEGAGGYVANSNVWRDGDLLRATLTLRVPSDKLTAALASLRGLAKRVERESVSSQDVTQEYVDLESQVRNLEATEIELRELLKTARVNSQKASEVLEVHQQLTAIRGQIEQAKGRMRYLSQVTAMSSVSLDITPDALAPGWHPLREAREATSALVALLQKLGTVAIWFVIYMLPVLALLGLVLFGFVRVLRRARHSSGSGSPSIDAL
ncbi:MAG TPA: DUF4349 domain-containing protein [Thermoanaerobaculia bacterium]|nr:DUF4349 domain-containing protein [Thermoanaerobaculia bacterium]